MHLLLMPAPSGEGTLGPPPCPFAVLCLGFFNTTINPDIILNILKLINKHHVGITLHTVPVHAWWDEAE